MDEVRRSSDWRPWAALVALVVLYTVTQVLPAMRHGTQNDFKHIYIGALLLSEGQDPYDAELMQEAAGILSAEDTRFRTILPYVYLPFTGLVLSPLSKLSFGSASILWQIINHLLLAGGLFLAARAAGWRWSWRTVVLLGLAVTFNWTVFRQNSAGQLNMVLFFGMALLYFGSIRGWHPAAIGGIAAFLMLFKITPGIFLIWFLLTRRFREAAFMMGWAVGLTLLSIVVAGWQVHWNFLPVLADMGYGRSTWWEYGQTFWRDPFNQSFNAFFHHVLVSWQGSPVWFEGGSALANAATWAASILLIGVFVWRSSLPRGGSEAGSFSLAVMTSLLVPSILWDHYLVQALLPAVLLWNAPGPLPDVPRRIAIASVVTVFCWNFNFGTGGLGSLLLSPSGPFLTMNPWGGAGYLLMSLKLWPALVLFTLCALQFPSAELGWGRAGKKATREVGNP